MIENDFDLSVILGVMQKTTDDTAKQKIEQISRALEILSEITINLPGIDGNDDDSGDSAQNSQDAAPDWD